MHGTAQHNINRGINGSAYLVSKLRIALNCDTLIGEIGKASNSIHILSPLPPNPLTRRRTKHVPGAIPAQLLPPCMHKILLVAWGLT